MSHLFKKIVFFLILRPLIIKNYAHRYWKAIPDQWYWADLLALEWGFMIDTEKRDYFLYKKAIYKAGKELNKK